MTSAFEGASGLTRKRCARRDGPVAMRSASHLDVAGCSFILIDFSARPRTPFIGIPWLFLPLTCQEQNPMTRESTHKRGSTLRPMTLKRVTTFAARVLRCTDQCASSIGTALEASMSRRR
jgi:hypothetical protein